jgi:hypothetical protein
MDNIQNKKKVKDTTFGFVSGKLWLEFAIIFLLNKYT